MSNDPTTKQKVDSILVNHLPTLDKKIEVVCAKVKILLWLNIGIAAAVVAEVILGRL